MSFNNKAFPLPIAPDHIALGTEPGTKLSSEFSLIYYSIPSNP
jgi:hypothetical protein